MNKKMNKHLLAFIIGVFVSFISMLYIFGADVGKNQLPNLHYLPFIIALVYGIANMMNIKTKQQYTWLIGGIVGLFFSIMGRFYLGNLPVKLFGFTNKNKQFVHPIAFIFYALVFQYIMTPLNRTLIPQ